MGSVIELHRVFAGDAVTQRGRAGHESGEAAIVARCPRRLNSPLCVRSPGIRYIFRRRAGEVSEDNNYLFPLSEAALHENKPEKKGRRM